MKRILNLINKGFLLVGAVLICSIPPASASNYDSVIRIGSDQNPTTMDPALYQDLASNQVMRNVFETLVAYDAAVKNIRPLLAESWTASKDLSVWTVKLKKGIRFQKGKFQNGREVTAADVKYSFDREIKISGMVRLYMVEKTEVVDKYTVKITLKNPYAPFLTVLTDIGAAIVPREETEGWGDKFTLHPVGTGPYKMVEWIKDDHMTFERDENYWGNRPYLKKIVFKFIPDKSILSVALLSKEVEITTDILDPDIPNVISASHVDPVMTPGCNIYALYMNSTNGATVDPKVRKAIFHAIDVNQIARVLFPNKSGVAAFGPIPPGSWAYNPDVKKYYTAYDLEKAKALLRDVDEKISMTVYTPEDPNRKKAALVTQAMLKRVGIELKIQSLEWGSFTEVTSKGKADMYTIGWVWYPDPEYYIYYMFHSKRKGTYGNGGGYNNPEVDRLIELGQSSIDQDERTGYYRDAEKLIMGDRVFFPLFHKNIVAGVNKKVHGYTVSPDLIIRLNAPGSNVWVE